MNRTQATWRLLASGVLCFAVLSVAWRAGEDVLPPVVGAALQSVIEDANQRHELGDGIALTGVWVERDSVRVVLRDATTSETLPLVLGHPLEGTRGFARYFSCRPNAAPPTPRFAAAIARLGPLLDSHLPTDPWQREDASVAIDRPSFVGHVQEIAERQNMAPRGAVASSAMAGVLALLSLLGLAFAPPKD